MSAKLLKVTSLFLLICLSCQLAFAQRIRKRKIKRLFKHSAIVNTHFTGFALYDMDKQRMVFELNSDKYFIPASNTKLFTFYTCLKMLADSIPALKYVIHHDSLVFWGTGDPSFLHSNLKGVKALELLKGADKKLFFAAGNYKNDFYGTGWAWDDYNDYYQAEINELPIEDNVALFYAGTDNQLEVKPSYLKKNLKCDSAYKPPLFRIKRDFDSNVFLYPAMPLPAKYRQEIPWKTSSVLTIALLEDTLKKRVQQISMEMPVNANVIYSIKADSVYKRMLQQSDNFMAEQLLLVCSAKQFGILNADSVIRYAATNFLTDLPDAPQWADGSGLSRMNLFTPRSIIALLNKIAAEVKDDQRLHSLFPAGGVSGTIRSAYKTDNGQPFVWAKTGSLSNNHNQSGYLVTRKGKKLAFSFMNNNFVQPSREIRDEMVRIITYIHENF